MTFRVWWKREGWGWYAAAVAAVLLSLVNVYSRNVQIFQPAQRMVSGLVLWAAVSVAVVASAFLLHAMVSRLARRMRWPEAAQASWMAWGMAAVTAAVYVRMSFYALYVFSVRQLAPRLVVAAAFIFCIWAALTLLLRRLQWKGSLLLLLVLAGLQGAQGWWSARALGRSLRAVEAPEELRRRYGTLRPCNIHVLLLESYQSTAWMQDFLNIDNSPLEAELEGLGFRIYPSTFANYISTLPSLQALFLMQHHYNRSATGEEDSHHVRQMLSGRLYNPVLSILKQNGYRIRYRLQTDQLYFPEAAGEVVDESWISGRGLLVPLNTFLYPHVFHERRIPDYRARLVEAARREGAQETSAPSFTLMKAGLFHLYSFQNSVDPRVWRREVAATLEVENRFLTDYCRTVVEADPDAVIILMGDHGAYAYGGRWWRGAENRPPADVLAAQGLPPDRVARDMAEIFLAIRWGTRDAPPRRILSPVNLFRDLFEHLGTGAVLDGGRAEDATYSGTPPHLYRVAKDGQPLAEWEHWVVSD
ncbi:MAG: hypothetical protein LBN38_02910 [Verrucomicrobiota bacterium]|jgi:hypothetical protein|nr:hypothetical protein [Verrucomicrobiota bacterium]